ncbi:MAG: NAD(P)H-dependent oxidoreductase [Hydrogenophaga sp.]|uniref:NAD(P)H-dependent oxidoreductase n=1 Tax=Hydrogenophaga sp. TaxID=1904254 RepID=UPI001DE458EC|nr:NAD(P)H-dependent oxidoreductase [Hydrogenophaga sp.]MBX3608481.1 NAD(P)H-dependent oxidoreductase [Hydrogenophaga sp.]
MQTLIVHAHPNPESFSAALFRLAKDTLQAQGHVLDTIDLYAEGFDPVLSRDERAAYLEAPDWLLQRFEGHIGLIRRAEHIVLVYPTWWWGPPAMLKGWLERVWLPKVTFEPARRKGERLSPNMRHVRRFTVITHGGSPWWWLKFMGDPHRRIMMRGMAMLFHPRCQKTWLQLHDMNNVTTRDREAFMARVTQALTR